MGLRNPKEVNLNMRQGFKFCLENKNQRTKYNIGLVLI